MSTELQALRVIATLDLLIALTGERNQIKHAKTDDFNESEERWVAAFREAR